MVIQSVLECPFCSEVFEVEPPDRLHTAYSSTKPITKTLQENSVKKKHQCKNPQCKKFITIYWYAPLDFLYQI
ncbi:MAG: hypothetical protein GX638_11535 [Crenarchaeota archaeon]|nr:hypothetical protein [Thermoproteota archaeon]